MATRPMSWPGPPSQVSCLPVRHIAVVFRDVTDVCATVTVVGHGQGCFIRSFIIPNIRLAGLGA
jgi:hypothetical protein